MSALENKIYLIAYIISNLFAITLLFLSFKHVKLSRILFFLLFGWASWANWTTAINSPNDYLDYADFTFLPLYKNFILGWFSKHTLALVGFIATAQALIAFSLLLKGWVYKLGVIGGIAFLVTIIPLGVGSAFPCTIVLAIALAILYKSHNEFIITRSVFHKIAVD
jgi:hypothetical protein